ncbi:MAG: KUP/HAK/KT family potassium transporter [Firmicutes bacterium]|nr:KUP/HAK/KT family potassium transporter [Bacillota bacterium]
MDINLNNAGKKGFSLSMFLVTIGIVYGDIGTSPLYVMKSIVAGNGGIGQVDEQFIIGALSLVIWTVTLLTTVKYILIALKADNHGEGGIFSLYALVKNHGKWLIGLAMLGGAALLADGVLTPAVTVTTAVEGLRSIEVMNRFLGEGQGKVVIITLIIICVLFSVQHSGTRKIGKAFGPCMLIWFSFLGLAGMMLIMQHPAVLKAFNPAYAVQVLLSPHNKAGLMILGSVFLATTGAEALYSDMGHVGRENIYISWPFVKACLVLNYLGQGAWIISNRNNEALYGIEDLNPFFEMLPEMIRPVAVILSTMAAVIASQALITGSYTLVSEAILLDLLPRLEIRYPSETKGQIYLGAVNNLLWAGCSFVVLYFRSGHKIEAAYGLAITVTMLLTTILLSVYLRKIKGRKVLSWIMLAGFGLIESVFFVSSLGKFLQGGYFTAILTVVILLLMIVWHRGTQIEQKYRTYLKISDHIPSLGMLRDDEDVYTLTQNLVYLDNSKDPEYIDRDILYSILDKDPKRAHAYWFVSVNVLDEPDAMNYQVETYGTDYIFRIRLNLGFKCSQRVNVYLRQIVDDLQKSGELPEQDKKYSIYGKSTVGSFKFCMIKKSVPTKSELSSADEMILNIKYAVRKIAGSRVKWYGLDNSSVIVESVPMIVTPGRAERPIPRYEPEKTNSDKQ